MIRRFVQRTVDRIRREPASKFKKVAEQMAAGPGGPSFDSAVPFETRTLAATGVYRVVEALQVLGWRLVRPLKAVE